MVPFSVLPVKLPPTELDTGFETTVKPPGLVSAAGRGSVKVQSKPAAALPPLALFLMVSV